MIAVSLRRRALSWVSCSLGAGMVALTVLVGGLADPTEARPAEPKVRVELVSESRSVQPGGAIWVGLRQRIKPGWHTYWINPGDSGEPPTIDWILPAGFEAGSIEWPHPERIPVGPAMSFGYSGEVVLLTRITAPAELDGRARDLAGRGVLAGLRENLHPRGGARHADTSRGRGEAVARPTGRGSHRAGAQRRAHAEPVAGLVLDDP